MTRYRSVAGLGTMLGLALLVTACATSTTVQPDTRFTADSSDSIVVIGLSSARPGQPPSLLSDGTRDYRKVYIYWEKSDAPQQGFATMTDRATYSSKDSPQHAVWDVHLIQPGTYTIRSIFTHAGIQALTTKFTAQSDSLEFTIRPGELLYIGDLHVDVVNFPATLEKLTRNDAQARKALEAYPGVVAPLTFRPPVIRTSARPIARPIPVSQD